MANKNPYLRQNLRIAPVQKMILTPALLHKIELLTLSHLDLTEFIKAELLQNPVLDEVTDNYETTGGAGPEPEVEQPHSPGEESMEAEEFEARDGDRSPAPIGTEAQPEFSTPPDIEEGTLGDAFEEVDYGPFFQDYLDPGYRTAESEDYERPSFENFAVKPISLYEHLLWQLNMIELREAAYHAATEIIGNLDVDGYLKLSDEEIATAVGCSLADITAAITAVRSMDPPGVGSRDSRECLLIQLRYWGEEDSLAYRILERHAPLLESNQLVEISRLENCSLEDISASVERIRRLDPKPGLQYQPDATIYIQPDVYIHKVGHKYVITLNEDGLPKLHINPYYRRLLERGGSRGEERRFIREKFKSAIELIRNLDHRKRTIYRVCEIIVERQHEFLDNGFAYLKPMLLKDVAEELGLHTSTISRAVTNKWVHCPQGILEIRQFFTLGFKTGTGEDISVHILKKKIKDMIDHEPKDQPLSDDDITQVLNRQGIEIKRRTVAKYREEMHLPNSRERRVKPSTRT